MKNKFLKYTLGLAITAFTLVSCDDDQNVDQSTLVPTNPTVSVALSFDNTTTLVEQNADYNFTVSLSEPQVVDVKVYLSQTGGDATLGEDYDMPDSVIIPANANSVTGVISILEDDTIEDLETVIITIGAGVRTANANVNATTVTFNIANLTTGDLLANLSWAASELTTDNSGTEIEATDLADMRLLVTDVPYSTIIKEEDGAAFETITLDATTPDGEYYIVADFFAASEIPADLDITISFDQVGVINGETYTFPAALNTGSSCSAVYAILAKITKTGDSYEIEEVGQTVTSIDISAFVGTWSGKDSFGYETQVVTSLDINGQLQITGMGLGWMLDYWEEIVTNQEVLPVTVNVETGEFTIDEAYYLTTTWNGAIQDDYNLSATGTLNPCSGEMSIVYDFIQAGTSFTEQDYGPGEFSENITLD
ncbi:hypothetical protein [Cellulophaga baltica]|uniref:Calx-beta domain-containing protein n=1 Tax=Cellulophaga baltica TaxID=76594 RepID=A0A1G7EJP2_9FLAO|nr:hypothetical protein [Cellulophaga baltica]SDE63902.1 hypothetical protein SAMN04487992_102366 [Cellulophaga baltica]